jgi:micrococcal nuclease
MGALFPFPSGRGIPAAPIRLMIWIGLLLGLLIYQAIRLWQAPYDAAVKATAEARDLYAEARRSRAILEEQEGPPPTAIAPDLPGPATSAPATTVELRVIDGDTFDYGGTRIRIADIDTPEIEGRCAYETALAARATRRLGALLAAGAFELRPLASGRDEDRYGRKLRIVTRGGRSLGDTLVAEGLARTWTGRREPWCGP